MSIAFTAKVKGGTLVVDPEVELPEGATVTVYLEDEVRHGAAGEVDAAGG